MPEQIQKMVKGSAPSLIEADQANKLIEAINQIGKMKGKSPIKVKIDSSWKIDFEFTAEPEVFDVVLPDNTAGERELYVKPIDPFADA